MVRFEVISIQNPRPDPPIRDLNLQPCQLQFHPYPVRAITPQRAWFRGISSWPAQAQAQQDPAPITVPLPWYARLRLGDLPERARGGRRRPVHGVLSFFDFFITL